MSNRIGESRESFRKSSYSLRAYIEGCHAWDGLLLEVKLEKDYQISWKFEMRVKLNLLWMKLAMWVRDLSYSWSLFQNVAF